MKSAEAAGAVVRFTSLETLCFGDPSGRVLSGDGGCWFKKNKKHQEAFNQEMQSDGIKSFPASVLPLLVGGFKTRLWSPLLSQDDNWEPTFQYMKPSKRM